MSAPRVVVVGSGIGGSAATLLLAHAGLKVTLLEKNPWVGGACSGYEKDGFHLDVGTHMFSRGGKGPLGDVLRRVGREDAIEFRRTPTIMEIRMPARPGQRVPDGVVRVPAPAAMWKMPAFAWRLARAMNLDAREAARAARLFTHILTMSEDEVASWNDRTVEEFVRPYSNHGPTLSAFGFLLGLYFVLPYWEVSAGEALWCFRKMIRDNALSYPRGGSIAIPQAYCKLAQARGADVRVKTGVKRIVVEAGVTRGVELADGTVLPADIVISTSSLRTTVLHLVGAQHFPADYVDRIHRIKASQIAVQAKIALNKKLVDAGCLIGGVGEGLDLLNVTVDDAKEMFNAVMRGEVPPVVPFYCPIPTNFDPSLAPPGHQLLTVCALAPTSDITLKDPGPAWEEAMLRTMRRIVPRLDDHVVFIDRMSVGFIENWIGKEFGPAISTGQTPDQVGTKRPPVHTPIRGLYFAGCMAGARGVGTELAASSAMECVDHILAELGRRTREPSRIDVAATAARDAAFAPLAWATRRASPPPI